MTAASAAGQVGTTIAFLKAASGPAKRVFGPALDEVGFGLAYATATGIDRLGRVFENARRKITDEELKSRREVQARVMKPLVDQGLVADSEIVAEYLGGVMASAALPDGGDRHDPDFEADLGVMWLGLIGQLSSAELAVHFVTYRAIFELWLAKGDQDEEFLFNPYEGNDMKKLGVFMPLISMYREVDVSRTLNPALVALRAHGLIGNWRSGALPSPIPDHPLAVEDGKVPAVRAHPTSRGLDLYVWGLGLGAKDLLPSQVTVDEIVAAPLENAPRIPDVTPA